MRCPVNSAARPGILALKHFKVAAVDCVLFTLII